VFLLLKVVFVLLGAEMVYATLKVLDLLASTSSPYVYISPIVLLFLVGVCVETYTGIAYRKPEKAWWSGISFLLWAVFLTALASVVHPVSVWIAVAVILLGTAGWTAGVMFLAREG